MEVLKRVILDTIQDDGEISVLTQQYIEFNGETIILNNHREALNPTQIERAEEILSEEQFQLIKSMWTPKLISRWELEHEKGE